MTFPLQIAFRNMDFTESLDTKVREKAAHLDKMFGPLTRCDVVIEAPHHHHSSQHGRRYHVRIALTTPIGEIVVRGDDAHANEDPRAAVRDAFEAAHGQLQQLSKRRSVREAQAAAD